MVHTPEGVEEERRRQPLPLPPTPSMAAAATVTAPTPCMAAAATATAPNTIHGCGSHCHCPNATHGCGSHCHCPSSRSNLTLGATLCAECLAHTSSPCKCARHVYSERNRHVHRHVRRNAWHVALCTRTCITHGNRHGIIGVDPAAGHPVRQPRVHRAWRVTNA